MLTLEELIKLREEAIKKEQEQIIEERNRIEKYLMESSIVFYNEYISPTFEKDANSKCDDELSEFIVFGRPLEKEEEKMINELFNRVPYNNTFKILTCSNYLSYTEIDNDPIIYIETLKKEIWFTRISYLQKIAAKEKYAFYTYPAKGMYNGIGLNFSSTLPKLEIPKHKVLTLED